MSVSPTPRDEEASVGDGFSPYNPPESIKGYFFKVIDIPNNGLRPKVQNMKTSICDCGHGEQHERLDSIPDQEKGTIRVILDGRSQYCAHRKPESDPILALCSTVAEKYRPAYNPNGYMCYGEDSVFSDYAAGSLHPWEYSSDTYNLPALRKMWTQKGQPSVFVMSVFARHKHLCRVLDPRLDPLLREFEDENIAFSTFRHEEKAIIICFPFYPKPEKVCGPASWTWLRKLYESLQTNRTSLGPIRVHEDSSIQLILHEILMTTLRQNHDFLSALKKNWDIYPDLNIWARSRPGPISGWGVEATGKRKLLYQSVENTLCFGSAAVELISKALRSSVDPITHGITHQQLIGHLDDAQEDCDFYKQYTTRLKESDEQTYLVFVNEINLRQADSVKRLSLLAAIFLPLSLAAGVLSMQTRFSDLRLLLYDFLGVMIILGTIAFIVAAFSRYGSGVVDHIIWRSYGWLPAGRPVKVVRGTLAVLSWSSLLASFLVGMLKDVKLGLKILGIEAASITVLWLISLRGFRRAYEAWKAR